MILTGNFTVADPGNTEQYPHDFKTAFAPVPVPPAGSEPKEYEGKYFTSGNMLALGANSTNKEASFAYEIHDNSRFGQQTRVLWLQESE